MIINVFDVLLTQFVDNLIFWASDTYWGPIAVLAQKMTIRAGDPLFQTQHAWKPLSNQFDQIWEQKIFWAPSTLRAHSTKRVKPWCETMFFELSVSNNPCGHILTKIHAKKFLGWLGPLMYNSSLFIYQFMLSGVSSRLVRRPRHSVG